MECMKGDFSYQTMLSMCSFDENNAWDSTIMLLFDLNEIISNLDGPDLFMLPCIHRDENNSLSIGVKKIGKLYIETRDRLDNDKPPKDDEHTMSCLVCEDGELLITKLSQYYGDRWFNNQLQELKDQINHELNQI